ncbi:hypothetical protein Rsub_08906 [Raphidocelis subcapitata]|uniref:N-acetyltransferase domain-containing protein n=1 Tax=Raphidocelis subcapitata TaxID=307507 RepID=A0A2V0P8G7_9CHLO|nr:hypothetical protein Rsub_08906 [Raphidocelis subcapitata]|eukprot:GBF96158.1 hypothetical protein Rsub_08906 [Raphidocelis subcapitata]
MSASALPKAAVPPIQRAGPARQRPCRPPRPRRAPPAAAAAAAGTGAAAAAAPPPSVRRAEARDVAALAAIERLCAGASAQWSAADIEAELSRDIALCFVAEAAGSSGDGGASSCDGGSSNSGGGGGGDGGDGGTGGGGGAGAPGGFIVGWLVAGELQLLELAVHPDCRRRGLGAALLRRLLLEAGCDAAAAAVLEVRADNGGALALYAAHGFGEVGRRRRYYPDGCDALLMARPPGPLKGG